MTLAEKVDTGIKAAVETVATLVELRKQRGLTQYDIAEKLGIGQPYVSSFERSTNPTLSMVARYGDALDVRVALSVVVGKTVITSDVTSS
jgi:transcriptional regulator with XRE-family HTH domain